MEVEVVEVEVVEVVEVEEEAEMEVGEPTNHHLLANSLAPSIQDHRHEDRVGARRERQSIARE